MMEPDPSNSGDVIKILDNDSQIILMHNNYVSFRTVRAFLPFAQLLLTFALKMKRLIIVELRYGLISNKLTVDQSVIARMSSQDMGYLFTLSTVCHPLEISPVECRYGNTDFAMKIMRTLKLNRCSRY